jgi:hypothetical protein
MGQVLRSIVFVIAAVSTVALSLWAALTLSDSWSSGPVIRLENKSVITVTQPIAIDPVKVKPTDGIEFTRTTVIPRTSGTTLHIHVSAYASAPDPNVAVLSVFRTDQDSPLLVAHRATSDNRRVKIDDSVDVPAVAQQMIEFIFRIGPAYQGSVVLNGPDEAQTSEAATAVIEITERK